MLLIRSYVQGTRFTFLTVYHALRWIINFTDATGRLARWSFGSVELYFQAIHKAEIKHQAANAFSSLSTYGSDYTTLESDIKLIAVNRANL